MPASQETLLGQSTIWIFGRVMADLQIDLNVLKNFPKEDTGGVVTGEARNTPPRLGANNFLLAQLIYGEDPQLARIYGFTFENSYYDLVRPTIFLVHGKGIDAEGPESKVEIDERAFSRMPADPGRTGLGNQLGSFSTGLKAWAYDRGDFTLRLDADSGSFDTLLLLAELGAGDIPTQSGAHVRSAGAHVQSAGAHVRSAGAHVRSAGAHVRPAGAHVRSGDV
jgi:hypothetical protein